MQLQRSSPQTTAVAASAARHQMSGAAVGRHSGRFIRAANLRHHSEIERDSIANANPLRAAKARWRPTPSFHVGPEVATRTASRAPTSPASRSLPINVVSELFTNIPHQVGPRRHSRAVAPRPASNQVWLKASKSSCTRQHRQSQPSRPRPPSARPAILARTGAVSRVCPALSEHRASTFASKGHESRLVAMSSTIHPEVSGPRAEAPPRSAPPRPAAPPAANDARLGRHPAPCSITALGAAATVAVMVPPAFPAPPILRRQAAACSAFAARCLSFAFPPPHPPAQRAPRGQGDAGDQAGRGPQGAKGRGTGVVARDQPRGAVEVPLAVEVSHVGLARALAAGHGANGIDVGAAVPRAAPRAGEPRVAVQEAAGGVGSGVSSPRPNPSTVHTARDPDPHKVARVKGEVGGVATGHVAVSIVQARHAAALEGMTGTATARTTLSPDRAVDTHLNLVSASACSCVLAGVAPATSFASAEAGVPTCPAAAAAASRLGLIIDGLPLSASAKGAQAFLVNRVRRPLSRNSVVEGCKVATRKDKGTRRPSACKVHEEKNKEKPISTRRACSWTERE